MSGWLGIRPIRRWLLCLLLLIAVPMLAGAPTASAEDLPRLLAEILGPSPLEENLRYLSDEIGGRVSGSEANRRAVEWAAQTFRQIGVDRVETETFELPVSWSEGATRIEVLEPRPINIRGVSIA